jgi:predicted metal-dependent peptidase
MTITVTYHTALLRAMSADVAPYFGSYLLTLRPVETDKVPTAAVDKFARVYWNRAFFANMVINEAAFVVLHEMMHLFLRHAERAAAHGVTNFRVWNIATDCEINRTLSQMQGVECPASACLPHKFKLKDGSVLPPDGRAEAFYDALLLNAEDEDDSEDEGKPGEPGDKPGKGKPGNKPQHGTGVGDKPGDWELPVDSEEQPGASDVDRKMAEEQSARDIQEAANKQAGRMPGSLVRHAQAITAPPKVPWQRLLKAAVNHGANAVTGYDEPTYRRVAARSFSMGGDILLPTYESYQPRVAVGIDTSGSMSRDDLNTALRETEGVCKALDCTVAVFTIDTVASKPQMVTRASDIRMQGGGGTDMSEGVRVAMGLKPAPHITVIITDGYTGWPSESPNPRIKCIAVITEGGTSDLTGIPSWITAIKVS